MAFGQNEASVRASLYGGEPSATLKQDTPLLDNYAKQLCALDERFQRLEAGLRGTKERLYGERTDQDRPEIGPSLAHGSGTLGAIGSCIEIIAIRMNHLEELAAFFGGLA